MPYRCHRTILALGGSCLLLAWMATATVGQVSPRQEEIARLEERLRSPAPGARLAALVRLGMLVEETLSAEDREALRRAARAVAENARDTDPQVRLTAIQLLGRLDAPSNESAAAWLSAMADPEPGLRQAALQAASVALVTLADDTARTHDARLRLRIRDRLLDRTAQFAPLWVAGCRDLNATVRAVAARSLAQATRLLVVPAVWNEAEASALEAAEARGLLAAHAAAAELAEPLARMLHDQQADEEARLAAGRALEDLARLYGLAGRMTLTSTSRLPWPAALTEVLPLVAATLQAPRARIRLQAALTLEAYGSQARACRSALVTALADPSPFVRWTAVRTLTILGPNRDPQEDEHWHRLLVDPDPDVRRAAAQTWTAWEQLGPPPVVHAIAASNRGAASREGGQATAVLALVQALETGDVEQKLSSLKTLGQLGADAALAVPALTNALASKDAAVRRAVPDTLVRIGPAARFALPALEKCLRDEDREVRHAAARAVLALSEPRP